MFVHNIDPVLIHLGSLQIRYYGLVYALGMIFSYFFLRHLAKKDRIALDMKDVEDLILYLTLAVVIGGRVGELFFYQISRIWTDPLWVFRVWEGGMSFHGGLIGVFLVLVWFSRKKKIDFYDLSDYLAIPAALFLFLGRIANFINGELWGTLSDSKWCIDYSKSEYIAYPPKGCRHPSQIYEAVKNLIIFFSLIALSGKDALKKGVLTWFFISAYGLLRFIVNFWREDSPLGQWLSLGMFFIGSFMLWKLIKEKSNNDQ